MNELLERRIGSYLEKLEPAVAGQRGHNATFKAACTLVWGFGLSPEQAWPFALEYNERCMPPWSKRELRRKLVQAAIHAGHTKPLGYLLGSDTARGFAPKIDYFPLPVPQPTWPKPDLEAIDHIVRTGPRLDNLQKTSPVRFEESKSHAEEIIDILFPGNPILCCGKSVWKSASRRREVWRGKLTELSFIVPNPMIDFIGETQDGRLSERTKAATAKRVYQCVEFDFAEKAKDGITDTIWAPLIRGWTAAGISIFDACAALQIYLADGMPLVQVCHSGGKSLHGWFRVWGSDLKAQRNFMNCAVRVGADSATWNKSQLVRLPDGQRDTGARQTVHYFNPREAVTA